MYTMRTMEELYESYLAKRSIDLTLEQFTLFAEFFPAVLVILSDGTLDAEEKLYLGKLAKSLAQAFSEDGLGNKRIKELQNTFIREFEYLVKNVEFWKDKYLLALKNHLEDFPESKETILDTLYLFAEKSQDVDEAENNMILYLTKKLNLMNTKMA
ncbi:MAG: hypothetical protein HC880_04135 [Bacteroidia bacterium]|nr:hypothetical protein [Bacteroidia bacterium]